MTDTTRQITDLEQALAALPPDAPARATLEALIAQLRAALPRSIQSGGINLGSAHVETIEKIAGQDAVTGDKVLGDKIVQQFFGDQPDEDGEKLLRDYLVALLDANRTLRLSRKTEQRQSGSGQDLLPPLKLVDVFTNLSADGPPALLHLSVRRKAHIDRLLDRLARRDRGPDAVPPGRVRDRLVVRLDEGVHQTRLPSLGVREVFKHEPDERELRFGLARPELVLDSPRQSDLTRDPLSDFLGLAGEVIFCPYRACTPRGGPPRRAGSSLRLGACASLRRAGELLVQLF